MQDRVVVYVLLIQMYLNNCCDSITRLYTSVKARFKFTKSSYRQSNTQYEVILAAFGYCDRFSCELLISLKK